MMRVTNQSAALAVQRSVQSNYAEMVRLQEKAADGRRITKASDDPAAAAQAMAVRSQAAAAKQHERNISDAEGWLNTADASLTQVTDILQRVRSLSVQGYSDNTSPDAREAIAVEVDALKDELLRQANSSHLGRTIYAGTSDVESVFDENYNYAGVPGSAVTRRITSEATVQVDLDGAAVFGQGAGSVFALMDDIASDMRSPGSQASRIDQIDSALDRVLNAHTTVGARQVEVERAADTNLATQHTLEARRVDLEDADLAELIIDLSLKEVAYQASLSIGPRILQPTLLDFIS